MKRKTKTLIVVILVIVIALVGVGAIFAIKDQASESGSNVSQRKEFCVIYDGKKILSDVYSFEVASENATFKVETVDGEPVDSFKVAVRAVYPRDDFLVTINGETLSWEKDFAEKMTFGADIVKDKNTFTIAKTSLVDLISSEYANCEIEYDNLTNPKNVLRIDVVVDGTTLSIYYFVNVVAEEILFDKDNVVC